MRFLEHPLRVHDDDLLIVRQAHASAGDRGGVVVDHAEGAVDRGERRAGEGALDLIRRRLLRQRQCDRAADVGALVDSQSRKLLNTPLSIALYDCMQVL